METSTFSLKRPSRFAESQGGALDLDRQQHRAIGASRSERGGKHSKGKISDGHGSVERSPERRRRTGLRLDLTRFRRRPGIAAEGTRGARVRSCPDV